ncbi:MAG: glycosyltransferase [Flavobacteriales bacterium]|nr:glycosyltransferase [Flavobacteriales bacterium]
MGNHLHIISFDVPWPANYGGVIDVFYKVKALAESGVRIHLHCFEYGRRPAPELDGLCESVHYYRRHTGQRQLFLKKPYIVVTRESEELIDNLLRDDFPILYEGLHTCLTLPDERLVERHKVVRTHNIEHHYYENLAKVERNPFKRYYFNIEAEKLKRFEKVLCNAQGVAAISQADADALTDRYPDVRHITAFHPNNEVESKVGRGDHCLYHGNLEVGENNIAALYLVRRIFSKTRIPLIIAGNRPSGELKAEVAKYPNIELRVSLATDSIHDLIRNAQVNVLPTFQATGIKLKLLAALFMGRHCVVNSPMVDRTGLEALCRVEDSDRRFIEAVEDLFARDFASSDIERRQAVLLSKFSNSAAAEKLSAMLFQN